MMIPWRYTKVPAGPQARRAPKKKPHKVFSAFLLPSFRPSRTISTQPTLTKLASRRKSTHFARNLDRYSRFPPCFLPSGVDPTRAIFGHYARKSRRIWTIFCSDTTFTMRIDSHRSIDRARRTSTLPNFDLRAEMLPEIARDFGRLL